LKRKIYFIDLKKESNLKGGKRITHSKERVVGKGKIKCPSKSCIEIILKHC
jgi:hypothetical protein